MEDIPPVHRITGFGTGNIYIIEDDEMTVVDTGVPVDYRLVAARVKKMKRSLEDIGNILLSHFHIDHAGGAASLKELSGARVYAHEDDVPYIQGDETTKSIYRLGLIGRGLSALPLDLERFTATPPVAVEHRLKDGDVIPILGGVEVIHSPGHTPGCVCYYWPREGILFSGDTIINTYRFLTPPTRGFSWDYGRAVESARKVADRFGGEGLRLICPGHGPMVSDGVSEKLRRFVRRGSRRGSGLRIPV